MAETARWLKTFQVFLTRYVVASAAILSSRLLLLVKLPFSGVRTSTLLNIHQSLALRRGFGVWRCSKPQRY